MNKNDNLDIKNNDDVMILDFKDVAKVFKKRRWWFIGVFIIILVISLLLSFNFSRNSQFGVKSKLSISSTNIDYQNLISLSFPEDSDKLWLVSTENLRIISKYIDRINDEIKSEPIINELNKSLGFNLNNGELKKQIRVDTIIGDENNIVLTTYSNNLNTAKRMNEILIRIYTNDKTNEFNAVYNELLQKVEKKLSIDQIELQKLSKESEDYVYNSNKKLLEDVSKSTSSDKIINFSPSSYIPLELQNRINITTKEYNSVLSIKNNLIENKTLYINRISVQNLSDIEINSFIPRNIIISFLVSLFTGIIAVYIVNFVCVVRKK
ncbi:MAG: hypothetical protein ACYDIA_09285 [Candidatus Humimicrobiaceae bacterium]